MMELEWMGDYRAVVEQLIRYCNIYAAVYKKEQFRCGDVTYSFSQVQVLEYLLENKHLNLNMSSVASRLGITFSSFSKLVSKLAQSGLVEKYYLAHNRKNIIVRVTPKGCALYEDYAQKVYALHFKPMFDELAKLPKEHLPVLARSLSASLRCGLEDAPPEKLIPVERKPAGG